MNASRWIRTSLLGAALAVASLAMPVAAPAQTATVYGLLTNFDVVNDTGQDGHGFEIQIEGLQANDVTYTFGGQRYGAATIEPYATGIYVRWTSPWDAGAEQFTQRTIPHLANTPFAGTCYLWGAGYDTSGCEHFGVSARANGTRTTYRWLVADPQTPGALLAVDPPVAIPVPTWTVTPPAQPVAQPVLVAEIQAPDPPEAPQLYGDAQWVKVFKTELPRPVSLDELLTGNAIVPQDPGQVEVAWDILQADPPSGGKQRRHQNQGGIAHGTRAVVRRYELYRYTGAYDPATHQVVCGGDGLCTAPLDGELGDYIGAQMAAANVEPNGITITKSGSGSVSSSDRVLACGSACGASYDLGTVVTLTASGSSGQAFTGWTGACSGTATTCDVTITGDLTVGAAFSPVYGLSIGRSGKGTVASVQSGIDCGKTCSAKFVQGVTVTLTAAPATGGQFVSWSGDCSGTALTCSLTLTRDTKVQANFK
jgi:uncharacterized repeat protein (TIGR02543 family)